MATGSPAKALAPLPAARQKAIEQIIVGVRKTYGKTSITSMAEDSFKPVRTISTGSLALEPGLRLRERTVAADLDATERRRWRAGT